MKTFLAIIMYSLSLFGIDLGSHIRTDRVRSNGTDVLYSKVVTQPAGTRFECLRSASGQCYYTVIRDDCASLPGKPGTACTPGSPEHFALARGDSRQMASLDTFRLCVSADAAVAGPDCE
ncbi:MAG: hypothetical protein ACJ8GK_06680 [Luteimonas sp.]